MSLNFPAQHDKILKSGKVHYNLSVSELINTALARQEGLLASNGALCVFTGKYTGRSPKDKFIVDESLVHDHIDWGTVNRPYQPARFAHLYQRVTEYMKERELFVFDGFAGANEKYRLPIRVINEFAWQNLFAHQLFIRPSSAELKLHQPEFTIIAVPGFEADPEIDGTHSEAFIICSLEHKLILIGGTHYGGEIKKSVFAALNYLLPFKDVFPMHCSANVGESGDVALFFGLSGTGKTTLSADPERRLIGDDEHGWAQDGVFNFEGGCYAKCINLSHEREPQIWDAIKNGTVLENVVIDSQTLQPDYDNGTLTENTRAAYPIEFIPGAVVPGIGGQPKVVVFLTADAFGVLPPFSKLTKEQAMYHFLSGYTSKLAGTERGVTEPEATFSTCFGAPFLPLPPVHYANMLGEKIALSDASVYLVNTGWTGGPYAEGKRMNLKYTRAMITAAINGEADKATYTPDPIFGVLVPDEIIGVPSDVLNQRATWENKQAYDKIAIDLAKRFQANFSQFESVADEVKQAGPRVD